MDRPSHKELNGKLQKALQLVRANRILVIEPHVIVADSLALGYSIRDELQVVLLDLLNSSGPDHYAGNHPPEKSYETRIRDMERWAFALTSPRFKAPVYFKFSLDVDYFYPVSLHVSTSAKEWERSS